tara:strand:- start:4524 stop:5630 length:1107 start_codon:yes stop_codon:yes gene_type:complete
MLYSIANAAPRNVESYGVNTLLPENIRGQAEQLVGFLEEYYNYLNGPNGPSLEINNVLQDKDLDNVSLKYLDSIQGLIAKNVPNSKVLDRVALYKIVVRYYNSRGSEDNILTMFKLLFNENATIRYPKELLFEASSSPEKSWPSHKSKIQDSYYWQNFSYVVRASLDASVWADAFNNFLHPAGLQMFYELIIELFAPNTFDPNDIPEFNISDESTAWINNLLIQSPGQHCPLYQPGWLRELLVRILAVANSRPEDWPFDQSEALFQLIGLIITIQASNSRNSLVRYDYDYNGFKFKDDCALKDGILNKTIAEANEIYSELNGYKFLNLSTYITSGAAIVYGYPALTLDDGSGTPPVLTLGGEILTLDS